MIKQMIREEIINLQEADVKAKKSLAKKMLISAKAHLISGAKKEGSKYAGAARALRSITKKEKMNPNDKRDLIKVTTDLLWRAGVIAIFGGVAGVTISVIQSALLSGTKNSIINALTESNDASNISDDELMSNYIDLLANSITNADIK